MAAAALLLLRPNKIMKHLIIALLAVTLFSCNNNNPEVVVEPVSTGNGIAAPKNLQASLLAEYPHDATAFTEGLFIYDGKMYESTGLQKQSFIQITDIKTGKPYKKVYLKDSSLFGEGINIIGGKLYQLTWQDHKAFAYNLDDLSKPVQTFDWQSEGWGMTNNGTDLIISDGGPEGKIYFVNPADFKIKRILTVMDNQGPVNYVNELEYIDGKIFANVFQQRYILQIDPDNGHVIGRLETADMLKTFYNTPAMKDPDNVLNGIAYDSANKKMFITGKRWPKMFELRLN